MYYHLNLIVTPVGWWLASQVIKATLLANNFVISNWLMVYLLVVNNKYTNIFYR